MKRLFGATILSALFSLQALADVVVVVHPENTTELSTSSVKRIFMGKVTQFSDGQTVKLINHSPSNDQRAEFDSSVLGRTTSQITAMWSKLIFTGRGIAPQEADSDNDVIEFVKNNKNAIGYIDASSATADVKIVNLD